MQNSAETKETDQICMYVQVRPYVRVCDRCAHRSIIINIIIIITLSVAPP